jgi:hypothetical protein
MPQNPAKSSSDIPYAREFQRTAHADGEARASESAHPAFEHSRKASLPGDDVSRGPFDVVLAVGISTILWILLLLLAITLFR